MLVFMVLGMMMAVVMIFTVVPPAGTIGSVLMTLEVVLVMLMKITVLLEVQISLLMIYSS